MKVKEPPFIGLLAALLLTTALILVGRVAFAPRAPEYTHCECDKCKQCEACK